MLSPATGNFKKSLTQKALWLVVIVVGFTTTYVTLVNIAKTASDGSVSTNIGGLVKEKMLKVGLPIRLIIPAIKVDAAIKYAGVDASGTMEISQSQDDVAWYKPGVRPGDVGSAVIAGHYGSLKGKYSVFSDLSKLNKGDKLRVQDQNGDFVSFVVRESRKYNPDADATDVFSSSDGKAHLNLVTCEGVWNNTKESYSERRIIFSDMTVE